MSEETAFKRWYKKNSVKLAESRKKRYREDPEYRERVVRQAAASRERARLRRPTRPEHYALSIVDVAEKLGVSVFTLRRWRDRDYYPEPLLHGGRLYFTEDQVKLLSGLSKFFAVRSPSLTVREIRELGDLTAFIYANWS